MQADKVRILTIEDNDADARLLDNAFRAIGADCQLNRFSDGIKAVEYIREISPAAMPVQGPQLIILDLNLPGLHGLEVLKELKADERLKFIPVIVFSSTSRPKDIQEVYEMNANCFIEKPFDYSQYQQAVRNIWQFWTEIVSLP